MKERDVYFMFIGAASIFMLVFDRLGYRSVAKRNSGLKSGGQQYLHNNMALQQDVSGQPLPTQRILCYGDSLTAGSSPPSWEMFPYSSYLEQALHQQTTLHHAIVRHRGLPGWTAAQMVAEANADQTGLRTAIRMGAPIDLVIILAGTNDLAYSDQPMPILQSILALHQICYDEGVRHTIALGIPPSGYQSVNLPASVVVQTINNELAGFAQREPRATFVPFPFDYQPGDDKWAPDGLHFSPAGYQVLGMSLAPNVESILKTSG
jgi:lysophospholipase L1-like esterase